MATLGIILTLFALLVTGALIMVTSTSLAAKHIDRLSRKFPRVQSFAAGVLIGVFIGVMPAALLYLATDSRAIAGTFFAACALACGAACVRYMGSNSRPSDK
jgi:sulfite exporter TauE/SafE